MHLPVVAERSRRRIFPEPIERLPLPPEVILPLSQHLGAPSKPIVAVGDKVFRGQPIAEAQVVAEIVETTGTGFIPPEVTSNE